MGLKIINGADTVVLGHELIRHRAFEAGLLCLEHGKDFPIRRLLKAGHIFLACQHCIYKYCDMGRGVKRAPKAGEHRISEPNDTEAGFE